MAEESLELADPLDPNDSKFAASFVASAREEAVDQAQRQLRDRALAYIRLFDGRATDGDRKLVMKDLERFCRGNDTPWADDARLHALLTGRQEVFRRIQDHLVLSFDDLWEKYGRTPST